MKYQMYDRGSISTRRTGPGGQFLLGHLERESISIRRFGPGVHFYYEVWTGGFISTEGSQSAVKPVKRG